ncbi:MAG: MBL fold metallo-hydrolase [Alphaproteobacteria bacterium]|nr:MBL fold metallo-hydrolase [Alphaproteobacteria bacterium]
MTTEKYLEYMSFGGNNHDAMFGSCHRITAGAIDKETGEEKKTVVIFDWGKNEAPEKFAGGQYDVVVPDLSKHVPMPGQEKPEELAEAIVLSHSHSDHIGGFEEYLEILYVEHRRIEDLKRSGDPSYDAEARKFQELIKSVPPIYATQDTINAIEKDMVGRRKKYYDPKGRGDIVTELQALGLRFGTKEQTIEPGTELSFGSNGELKAKITTAAHSVESVGMAFHNGESFGLITGDTKVVVQSELDDFGKGLPRQILVTDAAHRHKKGKPTTDQQMVDRTMQFAEEHDGQPLLFVLPAYHAAAQKLIIDALIKSGKKIIVDGGPGMQQSVMSFVENNPEYGKYVFPAGSEEAKRQEAEDERQGKFGDTVYFTTGLYNSDAENSLLVAAMRGERDLRPGTVVFASAFGKEDDVWETFTDFVREGEKNGKCKGMEFYTAQEIKISPTIETEAIPEMASRGHANGEEFDLICENNAEKGKTIVVCTHAEIVPEVKDKKGNVIQAGHDYYQEAREHAESLGYCAPAIHNGTVIRATKDGVAVDGKRTEKVGWLAVEHLCHYDVQRDKKGRLKKDEKGYFRYSKGIGKIKRITHETDHGFSSEGKSVDEEKSDEINKEEVKKKTKKAKRDAAVRATGGKQEPVSNKGARATMKKLFGFMKKDSSFDKAYKEKLKDAKGKKK